MSATPERLQKLIARAGLASRRAAESLIQAGAVRVNGRVVTRLGAKADPACDRIEVEGRRLRFPERDLYILLNKPRGCVCTATDPQRRRTVFHLLRGAVRRLFSVGRLPYEAEGVLLLTSDGHFADTVLRGRLPQTYWLKVKGALSAEELARMEKIAARRSPGCWRLRLSRTGPNPWYEVTVVDPRADWLRTAFFRLGHPVEKVRRVALGSLRADALAAGDWRELSGEEVKRLRREAAGKASPRQRQARVPLRGELSG